MHRIENAIWYIRVEGDRGKSSGSAVAVRLRDQHGAIETYFLTCGHIIAQAATSAEKIQSIHGWPPKHGFSKIEPVAILEMVESIRPFRDDFESVNQTANDWVVLRDNKNNSSYLDATTCARLLGVPSAGEPYFLYGYPGGDAEFDRNITNLMPTQYITFFSAQSGGLKFKGSSASPGESGGAVANGNGELIGLHRGKKGNVDFQAAVDIVHVKAMLLERGYEIVEFRINGPGLPTDGSADELWSEISDSVQDASPYIRSATPPTGLHINSDVSELSALDIEGRSRFFLLLDQLSRSDELPTELRQKITTFLETHQSTKSTRPPTSTPQVERPRVLIRMERVGPPGPDEEHTLYHYKIICNVSQQAASHSTTDTKQAFCKLLTETLKDIRKDIVLAKLHVEVMIPKELFDWCIEKHDIALSTFGFMPGVEFHFFLRVDRSPFGAVIEDRFHAVKQLCEVDKTIVRKNLSEIQKGQTKNLYISPLAGNLDEASARIAYLDIKDNMEILGIQWSSPPKPKYWEFVISLGIPLVVWHRDDHAGNYPIAETDVSLQLDHKTWNDIPQVVRDIRENGARSADPNHPSRSLAVVWDDPHDSLEDPLTSPH